MDCKKQVTTTFSENGLTGTATFTFHAVTVTVELTKPFNIKDEITSSELQQLPIRVAIKNLQSLLPDTDQSAK